MMSFKVRGTAGRALRGGRGARGGARGGRAGGAGDPPGGRRGWISTTVSPQGGVGPKMRHLVLYKLN